MPFGSGSKLQGVSKFGFSFGLSFSALREVWPSCLQLLAAAESSQLALGATERGSRRAEGESLRLGRDLKELWDGVSLVVWLD